MDKYKILKQLSNNGKVVLDKVLTTAEFASMFELDWFVRDNFGTQVIYFDVPETDHEIYIAPENFAPQSDTFFIYIPHEVTKRKRKHTVEYLIQDIRNSVTSKMHRRLVAREWQEKNAKPQKS
jgi:hypothetical protein